MANRLARVVLAGVLAGAASLALADEGEGPKAAPTRVRVTAPSASDRWLTGDLVAIDAGTLVLRRADREVPDRIPLGSITSMDRRLRPGRKLRGLGIGLLAGIAVGAVVGFAAGEDCNAGGIVCFDRGSTAGAGAAGLGLLGMAVGALVAPGEKWEATTAERLRLEAGPARAGGVGARLRVRF
jgi:hypothetical protein